jgi:hypothetical protein
MAIRTLFIIVLTLTVCVALAATNPTTPQYAAFLEAALHQALQRMDQTESTRQRGIVRDLVASQGKKIIESIVYTNTVRANYGLFSVFETRVFDVRLTVIGIGLHFFPTEGRDEIAKKLGRLVL